ncbi:uncharacterized protein LOC115760962 [Drosophila novamexicana]|uniref:uncharacterized protein LOC115760962 n=1 Tax=Drosophila novamexicana TaxID=47314 RepID=UPI0011E5EFB2|nr:uncharacterized protein LOC115760962 [Drosophila novamexicana]
MLYIKRYLEIAIGLSVFGLTMATNVLPHGWDYKLEQIRLLQFSATLVQIFGVLRAHKQHKNKFLLCWLVVTFVSLVATLYAGLRELTDRNSILGAALAWSLAVFVAALLNIMYNHYVEMTIGSAETDTEILQTIQTPVFETKKTVNNFI